MMFKLIFSIVSLLFFSNILAHDVELTCTLPTQNTDGSQLTDLDGIEWFYGPTNPPLLTAPKTTECTTTIKNLSEGTWYFGAKAVNKSGVRSDMSNIAVKGILKPKAPTGLVIKSVSTTAYQLNGGTNNKIYFSAVGTIPVGTDCVRDYNVLDKYMIVDRNIASIKPGLRRPRQVYADCNVTLE